MRALILLLLTQPLLGSIGLAHVMGIPTNVRRDHGQFAGFLVVLLVTACSPAGGFSRSDAMHSAALETDPAVRLDTYLQAQVRRGFSGVVLAARDGEIVLNRAYAPHRSALDSSTAFWIASNSKQFTAAAVLKLAEEGRLQVSDPITRFLQDVPGDKQRITVHHLLSHTSGLGHHYAAEGINDRAQAVQAILVTPLKAPPGSRYLYSNDGYSLLAAIIEIASGISFEEYLRTRLFEPVRLRSTGFWGFEQEVPAQIAAPERSARATANQKAYRDGVSYPSYGFRGATGIMSTTGDLYRWLRALRAGDVLSDSMQRRLFTPAVLVRREPQADVHYGYGWVLSMHANRPLEARHSGDEDWLGHNAQIRLRSDDVVIVLSNAGDDDGTTWAAAVNRDIWELLSQ